MKKRRRTISIAGIAFFLGAGANFAHAGAPTRETVILDPSRPDVTFQSIFSEKAQRRVVGEFLGALRDATGIDVLARRFEAPIHVKAKIRTKMGVAIREMVEDLIQARFEPSEVQIEIEGLRIDSPEATLRLSNARRAGSGLDFTASIRLKRTVASAERILIRFKSNQSRRTFMDGFYVELKGTSLRAEHLDSLSADIDVHTEPRPDGTLHVAFNAGILEAFAGLTRETLTKELVFDPGEVRLPPDFGIQIGRAVMPHAPNGLRAAVEFRKASIARLMIDPLVQELRAAPAKFFKDGPPAFDFPVRFEGDLPCVGKIGLNLMRYGIVGENQLQFAFGLVHPDYPKSAQGLNFFDHATDTAYERIDSDRASVVMGVGYRAIAWGLKFGLERCYADRFPKNLSLGRDGVAVRLDEPGNGVGVVALHAKAHLPKLAGLLLGEPTIEFPLKISPKLAYVPGGSEDDAKIRLDLKDADLSDSVLIGGYHSISSNLGKVRLKKIVLKKVRKLLRAALGNAVVDIPVPFARGADLRFAEVEGDGFGNLNLNLSLDPDLRAEASGFWSLFSHYLRPMLSAKMGKNRTATPAPEGRPRPTPGSSRSPD